MINIKRFVLHVSKKDPESNAVLASKAIRLKPTDNENEARIKEQIAKRLKTLREQAYYTHWYVVCEIETPEGQRLFRTVVGIHLF